MENMVLTLDELKGMPSGSLVWVEEDAESKESNGYLDGPYYRDTYSDAPILTDCRNEDDFYSLDESWIEYDGGRQRAWLRKPTDAEKAANPWPT